MNQIGLVLAGGGGKGAYQIGVWRYLKEKGLDQYVGGVSGTSVGALNAVLFAAGDIFAAEKIWKNITQNQILSNRSPVNLETALMEWKRVDEIDFCSRSSVEREINRLRNQAVFSREGLLKIMHRYVDIRKVQNAGIPCYATCLEMSGIPKVRRFDLRHYAKKSIETILLASSAIPAIFDPVLFDGKNYYDGGITMLGGDNIPIKPLYDVGIRFFIVVHLDRDAKIDRKEFPGSCILEIIPQKDLGNLLTGTLDFSPGGAAWRIEQGYRDTKKVFDGYFRSGTVR